MENSAYRGTDITARGETLIPGALVLSVWAKYFDGYKEEPLRATDNPSLISDTWNDYKRGSLDLGLKGEGDQYHYSARYYRNFGEHRFSDGWHSKDATDGIIVYGRSEPAIGLEISGGGDYRFQRGRLPEEPDAEWDKWEAGAYLQAEYLCRERITLTAGARYNYDGVAGEEVSPSFGLVLRPFEGTSLRAVAAHGFRSPQINELYMFPSSNEGLEAEKVWNYEAGLRQRLPGSLEIDLSVYRMDGENMIEFADNPSPPPMMRYANTGDFIFDGMEVSMDGNWKGGFGSNVSWSKLDPGAGRGEGRVRRSISASINMRNATRFGCPEDTSVIITPGTIRPDPIPSYTVVDIYGEAGVAGGVSVFAGLSNIGDTEYFIYTDLPGTGRPVPYAGQDIHRRIRNTDTDLARVNQIRRPDHPR